MSSSFLLDIGAQMARTIKRATGATITVELVGQNGYTITGAPEDAKLAAEWVQNRGLMQIESQADDEQQRTYTMIG